MRYTGPKNKLARRFGVDLGLKSKSAAAKLARRLNIPPGQHGSKRRKRVLGYGEQLSEKQKLKITYGVSERQLRKYYQEASKSRGATGEMLLTLLERRLDNVVYRLGFAPTRASARQLVSHGHVRVNGKRVNIPSYRVREGEIVMLEEKAYSFPAVMGTLKEEQKVPSWLEKKAAVGKVVKKANREEIDTDVNEQLIVEFFSR